MRGAECFDYCGGTEGVGMSGAGQRWAARSLRGRSLRGTGHGRSVLGAMAEGNFILEFVGRVHLRFTRYGRLASLTWYPISRRGVAGGAASSRMASNRVRMLVSWPSILRSSSASLWAKGSLAASIRRKPTKARMMATLTSTALSLRNTLESIATPCSVKAYGLCRRPPRCFDLPDWKVKNADSPFHPP